MPNTQPPKVLVIGIDPAFRKGGFAAALFDLSDRSLRMRKFASYIEFLKWLPEQRQSLYQNGYKVFIGVENANDQDAVFGLDKAIAAIRYKAMAKARVRGGIRMTINYILSEMRKWVRRGRDIGKVQAASQYTVETCWLYFGKEVVYSISPQEKGKKVKDAYFRKVWKGAGVDTITDYKGRVSDQDFRDAGMICLLAYNRARGANWAGWGKKTRFLKP